MAQPPTSAEAYQRTRTVLLAVITAILSGWALKATYMVTMPLVLAFFAVIVLRPLQLWLIDRLPGTPRLLSLVLTMLLLVAVLLSFAYALWYSLGLVLAKAPGYADAAQDLWRELREWARRQELPLQEALLPIREVLGRALALFTTGFTNLWLFTLMLVLFVFLVLLMLLESEEWYAKLDQALGERRAATVLETLASVETKIRRFLLIKILISALSGTAAGVWLWLLDVDFVLLWALMIFLLNFIPNIGSIVGVFPPSIVALLQFGPGWALIVFLGLAAIEQLLGNLVDPRLEGRTLSISPLVVLVSILFWGWVWGVVGALIGVLLTSTLVIIFGNIPSLRPIALLLSRAAPGEALAPAGEAPKPSGANRKEMGDAR